MTIQTSSPARSDSHPGDESDYGHFGIVTDPAALGLETSVIVTPIGPVTVRHGRRTHAPNAPAIILLHGAAGSWSTFTPLLQAASGLAASHRATSDQAASHFAAAGPSVPRQPAGRHLATPAELPAPAADADWGLADLVIPDLPGWGDSPLPERAADRSIEAIAASVASVARSLGYDQWMIVGHSLGGFVALELAVAEPTATKRVLLVSPTTFGVIEAARHPLRQLRALPAYVGMLFVMRTLARLGSAGTTFVHAIAGTRFFRLSMAPLFAQPSRIDRSVYLALAAEARPASFAIASARAGRYEARRWSSIRCPVRSVRGSADVFVADTDDSRLAATIPFFAAGTIPGTGHFAHIERPVEVLTRLFLA